MTFVTDFGDMTNPSNFATYIPMVLCSATQALKHTYSTMKNSIPMAAAVIALASSSASHAAIITQTVVQTAATGDDWTDAIWGTPAAAATVGNTYVMNDRVNTPDTPAATSTFAGDFLQVGSGGNLQIRARDGADDAVTANLILDGGNVGLNKTTNDANANYGQLEGTVSVIASTTIKMFQNSTSQRNLRLNSLVSGASGNILTLAGSSGFTGAGNVFVDVRNAGNTFAGTWRINDIRGIFASAGATGTGSFDILSDGYLRINDSWSGALAAVTGSEIEVGVGNTYTFNSLTVNGSAFTTAGTYTASELNTATSSALFSGDGSFVVVPEPSAALLGAFGLLGLLRRRR